MTGSHNDISAVHRSSVFGRLVEGNASPCNYFLSNREELRFFIKKKEIVYKGNWTKTDTNMTPVYKGS
jgi:hypothetical protein